MSGQEVPVGRGIRSRSPSVKRGYSEVAKESAEVGPGTAGGQFIDPRAGRRQPRKMNYGTNKVDIAGAEAAPIEIFVGNTNPRATDEIVKAVLLKCADNLPEKPELKIIDVKLLTNPERDPHPRFKSWKVTVPYSCKSLMENDAFYPSGWTHRKYFPKRFQGDRNVRPHLDPSDPVNIEIASQLSGGAAGAVPTSSA